MEEIYFKYNEKSVNIRTVTKRAQIRSHSDRWATNIYRYHYILSDSLINIVVTRGCGSTIESSSEPIINIFILLLLLLCIWIKTKTYDYFLRCVQFILFNYT